MKSKVDPYVDFIIVINSSKSKKAEFKYLNSIIEIKNKFRAEYDFQKEISNDKKELYNLNLFK